MIKRVRQSMAQFMAQNVADRPVVLISPVFLHYASHFYGDVKIGIVHIASRRSILVIRYSSLEENTVQRIFPKEEFGSQSLSQFANIGLIPDHASPSCTTAPSGMFTK